MLSQDRQNADLDRFALGETRYHLLSCRLLFSHSFKENSPIQYTMHLLPVSGLTMPFGSVMR